TPLAPEGALAGIQALRQVGRRQIDAAVAAVMAVHRAVELVGAPGWTSTSRSVGSGGQPLTDSRGVNLVVWFQDGLTGPGVDLRQGGKPKGHLAHDLGV